MLIRNFSKVLVRNVKLKLPSNIRVLSTTSNNINSNKNLPIGLLGLSLLQTPTDFNVLANAAVKKCEKLREEISMQKDPLTLLLLLDQISNEVIEILYINNVDYHLFTAQCL